MTATQRSRPQRDAGPGRDGPGRDPASRGLILVAVAVALGVILLIQGGGVGFDESTDELQIDETPPGIDDDGAVTTTTEEAAPSTSVPPAALKVVALNGAGVDGYAGQAQQFLSVAGYTLTTAATATSQTETTVVYFAPGFEVDAAVIAGLLGLELGAVQPLPAGESLARDPANFPPDTNVAVLLGPDVQGVVDSGAPADPTASSGSTGPAVTTETTVTTG